VITRLGCLACAFALSASTAGAQQARPQLNAGRVTAEIVVGTYTGIGGFIVGRYVGERVGEMIGVTSDDTRRRLGYTSGIFAGGLVTAGTVYGIGSMGDQTGDFATTYLGTGVGFVAAWGLSRAILGPSERPRSGYSTAGRWAIANTIAFLPSIGASIAFNSTRRAK
jgi:hypothetical protein